MSDGFAPRQVAAALAIGSVGVLMVGLQPQLLGALAREGTLTPAALGIVATAELLAMGLAAGAAGLFAPVARVRMVAAVALSAAVLLDLATARAGAAAILPLRALAGLAEGVLVWIAIGFIVRSATPARWSGLYLMVQTLAQLGVATAFGMAVIPAAGAAGGFVWLGVVTGVAVIAVASLPRRYAPLAGGVEAGGRPSVRGIVALAGVAAWLAFIVAIWVYIEPLAVLRGVAGAALGLVTPVSLGMQVLGAGAATLLADRMPARPTLIAVAAAESLVMATMAWAPTANAFVAASAAFGFLWLFALPFQLPLVIAADRGRRAAALIGGAQLVGAGAGPLLVGMLVGDRHVGGVLPFGAAMMVAALALTIGASARYDSQD